MIPLVINGMNVRLGATQPEYNTLPVRREVVGGQVAMSSLWEPTPNELKMLLDGGAIRLTVLGEKHPPVMLTVQPPPPISGA